MGLCQCVTNMKQGILKKSICDFYCHEKFKKSVSHCNDIVKISSVVIANFHQVLKCLEDLTTVPDEDSSCGPSSQYKNNCQEFQDAFFTCIDNVKRSTSIKQLEQRISEWDVEL